MGKEQFRTGETVDVIGWGTCHIVRDNEFNVTVRPGNHHEDVVVARGLVHRTDEERGDRFKRA